MKIEVVVKKHIFISHVLTAIIIVLTIAIYVINSRRDQITYASVDPSQNFNRLVALKEPNVSATALLSWAALAATNAYTMNFYDYEEALKKLKPYFTSAGYNNFIASLSESNFINDVTTERLTVSAVNSIEPTPDRPTAQPVLLQEGPLQGFYTWKIQLPLLVTFQGASENSTKQYYAITLLITRVPTLDNTTGIGIASLASRPIK